MCQTETGLTFNKEKQKGIPDKLSLSHVFLYCSLYIWILSYTFGQGLFPLTNREEENVKSVKAQ